MASRGREPSIFSVIQTLSGALGVFCSRVLLIALLAGVAHAGEIANGNILILHSNQRPTPAVVIIEDTVRKTMPGLIRRPVDIFSEFLDDEWMTTPELAKAQAEFLQRKYALRNIGVIIAAAPPALQFLLDHRDTMLPGVPVVTIALPLDAALRAKLPTGVVGRPIDLDPSPTFRLMRQLHPEAKHWIVVLGAADRDKPWERRIRVAAKAFPDVAFEYLVAMPTRQLLDRLRVPMPDTIVFTPGYFADGTGEIVSPRRSVERIAEASAMPVYGTLDTFMGTGIVGGYFTPYLEQAMQAAIIAADLLGGGATSAVDTSPLSRVAMLDARSLNRFHVDQSSLPDDAVVMYRDETLWSKHAVAIASGIALLVVQAALIGTLFVQRIRRRSAEAESYALAGRLITAHEDERRRLARDLHDDVTQRLARLAIDAGKIERNASSADGTMAARAVREGLVGLSEDVHALSYRLHPAVLDDLGLAEGLKAECGRLSQHGPITVKVVLGEVPAKLPREPSLCLFRVAQEALRNVVRHAQATAVTVSLNREGRGLRLTVRDDGRGFESSVADEHPSLGRVSMRERVRQIGGKLRIDTAPGHGTTVTAWVPVHEAAT